MKEIEGARWEKAILENYEAWILQEEENPQAQRDFTVE